MINRPLGFFLFVAPLLATSFISVSSFADASYSFGSSCVSQGSWTQKALVQNHAIIAVIDQLKNIKECQGIENLLPIMQAQGNTITPSSGAPDIENNAESLNGASSALFSFLNGKDNATLKGRASTALIRETLNRGALATDSMVRYQQPLSSLTNGTGRGENVSLQLFDQMTSLLPSYNSCLIGKPDQATALLAGFASMAASYAASGSGISPQIGKIASRLLALSAVVREQKFSSAIQRSNESEFWSSMSCLMETTAESYCSVEDAHSLINTMANPRAEEKRETNAAWAKLPVNEPISGYYVLAQHLPNVAHWVQEVQFGVPSRWNTDAQFKADAEQLVSSFKQSTYRLPARLNDDIATYNQLKTDDAKRNFLITMVQNLMRMMAFGGDGPTTNFYAQTVNPYRMPFFLLGMAPEDSLDTTTKDRTPPCVYASDNGSTGCDWSSVVQKNNFHDFPEFENPDALVKALQVSIVKLQADAGMKSSEYYLNRIIVNQANLVAKALVGQNYSVRASFRYINTYLENLEKFFQAQLLLQPDEDIQHLIPALRDTHRRLTTILEVFNTIDPLLALIPKTPEDSEKIQSVYKQVIRTVYDELDILWQRDSYMSGSITNFVYADYSLRVRRNLGFGKHESDYLRISGQSILDNIMAVHSMDPNRVEADLNQAAQLNLTNLNSIELVFSDSLLTAIERLNQTVNHKGVTDWNLNVLAASRLWRDTEVNHSAQHDSPALMFMSNFFGPLGNALMQKMLRPDLYPVAATSARNIRPTQDTRNHDLEKLRNKLCIQSLAFENRDRFSGLHQGRPGLCDGVVLMSEYTEKSATDRSPLNVYYDDLIRAQKGDDYQGDNVCALRSFFRKNQVYYLLRNLDASTAN